jgi:chromosome segregation protein
MQAKRQLGNLEYEHEELSEKLKDTKQPDKIREINIVREELLRIQAILDDYKDVNESVAQTENQLKDRLVKLTEKLTELNQELNEANKTLDDISKQYQDGMNETLGKVESEVNGILSTVEFAGQVRFNLTTIDDEYGVEFKTRIRGDEFSNLSAGSGGERSLVAIGLILALQRFNPAPVYALDEIDTFLDATNTEMVSRLLHDSSRRSQFILFTPAKSTHLLKHADKRIGVVSPGGVEPSVIIESPKFEEGA